jgi:hypothetical protein
VRKVADGRLYLLPGTSNGTLGTPTPLSGSFTGYDRVIGVGDMTGDGRPDLVARAASTGMLWLFPGTATGLKARQLLAPDLRGFDLLG